MRDTLRKTFLTVSENTLQTATDVYGFLTSKVVNPNSLSQRELIDGFKIDRNLQIYYFLLRVAEKYLSDKADEARAQQDYSFFRKSMDNPAHGRAFECLMYGKPASEWIDLLVGRNVSVESGQKVANLCEGLRSKGILDCLILWQNSTNATHYECELPFFVFYCYDNGMKPIDALEGLLGDIPLFGDLLQSIDNRDDENYKLENLKTLFPIKCYTGKDNPNSERIDYTNCKNSYLSLSDKNTGYYFFRIQEKRGEYTGTSTSYKSVTYGPDKAFNSHLLDKDSGGKLVFVTEYITAASFLEKQIIDNFSLN